MKILKEIKYNYVYDDKHYKDVKKFVYEELEFLSTHSGIVSKDERGYKVKPDKITNYIESTAMQFLGDIAFRNPTHAYGLGNNNAYEIVFYDHEAKEKQICGLLHINIDYKGNAYCFVTNIDGEDKGKRIEILRWDGNLARDFGLI
jgi:hypothetical protein